MVRYNENPNYNLGGSEVGSGHVGIVFNILFPFYYFINGNYIPIFVIYML